MPFNLTSLETAFGMEEGKRLGDKLIAAYGPERKVTILELRQNPDPEIAALADYVYEHVFVHYTMKQWGQKPEDVYKRQLIGLLQHVPADGLVGLGPVPGAAVGTAQQLHDAEQVLDVIAGLTFKIYHSFASLSRRCV